MLSRNLQRLAGAPLCAVATLVVAALGLAVYANSALVRVDVAIVRLVHRLGSEEVTSLARDVTGLAATDSLVLVGSAAVAALLLRGSWHRAVAIALSVAGTQAVVFGLKALVGRERPPGSTAWVDAAGHAFPSAHAASGVALYGLLAFFLLRRLRGGVRVAVFALSVLAVGSVGLTRIYLGAHYPSDVLAGWLVGAVVAAAAWQVGRVLRDRLPRAVPA